MKGFHLPWVITQSHTLRELATNALDICGVPKRSFFEMAKYFIQDSLEKERMEEFASTAGQVIMQF